MASLQALVLLLLVSLTVCQDAQSGDFNASFAMANEMSHILPAIGDRFQLSLDVIKDQMEAQLASVMSKLDNPQLQLELTSDVIGDMNYTNMYGPGGPPMTFQLSPSALESVSKSISDSLRFTITEIVDEKINEAVNKISSNQDSALMKELKSLESTYSRLYKKLFQYTRHQLTIVSSQLRGNTGSIPLTTADPIQFDKVPRDCSEAKQQGQKTGVTKIQVEGLDYEQEVWCDQDTDGGGWTVLLQRLPDEGNQLDFKKNFDEYRKPFGDASKEYWLGLDAIHQITSNYGHDYMLRVEVKKGAEEAFSKWNKFRVEDSSSDFKMHVSGFSDDSTAGDAMEYHSGMKFSTHTTDNDKASGGSCSQWSGNGGWWFNYCYYSNPTGLYPPSDLAENAQADHFLEWRKWQGYYVYLTHFSMKIRPN